MRITPNLFILFLNIQILSATFNLISTINRSVQSIYQSNHRSNYSNIIYDHAVSQDGDTVIIVERKGHILGRDYFIIYKKSNSSYTLFYLSKFNNQNIEQVKITSNAEYIIGSISRSNTILLPNLYILKRNQDTQQYVTHQQITILDKQIRQIKISRDCKTMVVIGQYSNLANIYRFNGSHFLQDRAVVINSDSMRISSVDINRNGSTIIFGANQKAYLYQYNGTHYLVSKSIDSYYSNNNNVAIDDQGIAIAFQSSKDVKVYRKKNQQFELINLLFKQKSISGLQFSSDGRCLAVADQTNYTQIYTYIKDDYYQVQQKVIGGMLFSINSDFSVMVTSTAQKIFIYSRCDLLCLNCSSLGICSQCKSGAEVVDGSCECKAGYTKSALHQECVKEDCSEYCNLCTEDQRCLLCFDLCSICDFNQCFQCKETYFVDENNSCSSCTEGCATCFSQENCTGCLSGYELNDTYSNCSKISSSGYGLDSQEGQDSSNSGDIGVYISKLIGQIIGCIAGIAVGIAAVIAIAFIIRFILICLERRRVLIEEDNGNGLHQERAARSKPHTEALDIWEEKEIGSEMDSNNQLKISQRSGEVCSICLDGSFMNVKLTCRHMFHIRCILDRTNKSPHCPNCRSQIENESIVEVACSICGKYKTRILFSLLNRIAEDKCKRCKI